MKKAFVDKKTFTLYLKEYTLFHKTNNIEIFNKVSELITTFSTNFYWDLDMKILISLYLTFSHISIDIHLC